jgi:hypothetical protein
MPSVFLAVATSLSRKSEEAKGAKVAMKQSKELGKIIMMILP